VRKRRHRVGRRWYLTPDFFLGRSARAAWIRGRLHLGTHEVNTLRSGTTSHAPPVLLRCPASTYFFFLQRRSFAAVYSCALQLGVFQDQRSDVSLVIIGTLPTNFEKLPPSGQAAGHPPSSSYSVRRRKYCLETTLATTAARKRLVDRIGANRALGVRLIDVVTGGACVVVRPDLEEAGAPATFHRARHGCRPRITGFWLSLPRACTVFLVGSRTTDGPTVWPFNVYGGIVYS